MVEGAGMSLLGKSAEQPAAERPQASAKKPVA
jgi:hypothetical protein